MTPSDSCIAAIKSSESCRLAIYPDLNGFATIGWGHKLTHDDVVSGRYANGITQAIADAIFLSDLIPIESQVNDAVLAIPFFAPTQGQFDALFDFCFNLGISRLQTLLAHGIDQVPAQLPHWIYASGAVAPGLVKRRALEVSWWQGKIAA